MTVRIAIPEPTSSDIEYNRRSLPQYLSALRSAGLEPVVVPLNESAEHVTRLLTGTQGVLLPGSGFDVDPQRYGEDRIPECGPTDVARSVVDELLLEDAFGLKKPILAICHGAQTLNVWRGGALVQDLRTGVNHQPGREVAQAHAVLLSPGSRLERLIPAEDRPKPEVNSSHHQAVCSVGSGLRVAAISPLDGTIEAVELDSESHFAVGVQWHPERTYSESAFSRAIFAAFAAAAAAWESKAAESPVGSAR